MCVCVCLGVCKRQIEREHPLCLHPVFTYPSTDLTHQKQWPPQTHVPCCLNTIKPAPQLFWPALFITHLRRSEGGRGSVCDLKSPRGLHRLISCLWFCLLYHSDGVWPARKHTEISSSCALSAANWCLGTISLWWLCRGAPLVTAASRWG